MFHLGSFTIFINDGKSRRGSSTITSWKFAELFSAIFLEVFASVNSSKLTVIQLMSKLGNSSLSNNKIKFESTPELKAMEILEEFDFDI